MATLAHNNVIQANSLDEHALEVYNKITNAGGLSAYFLNADVVMCAEQCPSTGNWHVHAAFHAPTRVSRRQLQGIFGNWDFRVMKGSPHQSKEYVVKNGGLVAYVGNQAYWEPAEVPLRRAPIS